MQVFCMRLKQYWRRPCTCITYTLVLIGYSVTGALIFMLSELNDSTRLKCVYDQRCLKERIRAIDQLSGLFTANSSNALKLLQVEDIINELDFCHRNSSGFVPKIFNYLDSMAYSISVYTTVGYGLLAPRTTFGRIATLIYGIIGIPLYMAFSMEVGDWIDEVFDSIAIWIRRKFQKKENKVDTTKLIEEELAHGTEAENSKGIQFGLICLLCFVYLSIFPVFVMFLERIKGNDWDYISSVHFVFASVTLIGFGDLMATREFYLTFLLPCIFVGQILLAVLITKMVTFIRNALAPYAEPSANVTPVIGKPVVCTDRSMSNKSKASVKDLNTCISSSLSPDR
ncbi:ion channel domain-containing protein [Ditylenchus destructor]|uniref:Ion channel domain-containing protein n=1 Tax=Ditylenchus destructor TaxID=166010 RepID=A0AAD4NCW0_9BILA|nr:ion channel domain-containing protein [Ditylenchus destructor]